MPELYSNAEYWFHRAFKAEVQKAKLLLNNPEDWARLQVWDGNGLKPVMSEGFSGEPTLEQINMLYSHVQKNELFFFELGNTTPKLVVDKGFIAISMEPKEPPQPRPVVITDDMSEFEKKRENQRFIDESAIYKTESRIFKAAQTVHQTFGPGFKTAVEKYNAGRNMDQERTETKSRGSKDALEVYRINRARADQVITEMMSPHPGTPLDIFYEDNQTYNNATIDLKYYHKQLLPNQYDLPENEKLTDSDAATINFAMLGVRSHMKEVFHKTGEMGPKYADVRAKDGFHMLITGLFGTARNDQPLADCLGAAMKLGKESIKKYLADGDPSLLGQRLGECVKLIKLTFTGYGQNTVSHSVTAATKLTERLLNLFDKNPDIWEATGLNEQDRDFMHGYVQIGNIYDRYLDSQIKYNAATTKGIELSKAEKTEVLVNAVIRRMVENELAKGHNAAEASDAYKARFAEALVLENAANQKLNQWKKENLSKYENKDDFDNAVAKQQKLFDVNAYTVDLGSHLVEHPIIAKLAQPGMLELLRQNLMADPAIAEQAGKSPMDLSIEDMTRTRNAKKMDALVAQVQPSMDKVEWFFNFKSMLTQEGLDPNVAANSDRLMITQTGAKGTKSLASVASLLQGSLQALQEPDRNTVDLLYEHAKNGNLFFYGKDKGMPARLSADGAQVSAQQLEPHPQPTRWMRFWNAVTFGLAYRAECNPKPEIKLFTDAREARTASLQNAEAPVQEEPVHTEEKKAEKTLQQPRQARMTSELKKFENKLDEYAERKNNSSVAAITMAPGKSTRNAVLDAMLVAARRSAALTIKQNIEAHPKEKANILAQSYRNFDAMIADIKEFLPKTFDSGELDMLIEKGGFSLSPKREPLGLKFDFIAETALENYQNFVNAGKTDNFRQRQFDLHPIPGKKTYCAPLGVKKDAQPSKELKAPEMKAPNNLGRIYPPS